MSGRKQWLHMSMPQRVAVAKTPLRGHATYYDMWRPAGNGEHEALCGAYIPKFGFGLKEPHITCVECLRIIENHSIPPLECETCNGYGYTLSVDRTGGSPDGYWKTPCPDCGEEDK